MFISYDMSLSLILIKVKSFLECCFKSGFVTYTSLFLECEMSSYFEINKATNINFAFFATLLVTGTMIIGHHSYEPGQLRNISYLYYHTLHTCT